MAKKNALLSQYHDPFRNYMVLNLTSAWKYKIYMVNSSILYMIKEL
uniref:Uncharacterized protein n=1 Tax=Arundo donax TaxID=35708 RepID=A0A0A8ZZE4_ARUDO